MHRLQKLVHYYANKCDTLMNNDGVSVIDIDVSTMCVIEKSLSKGRVRNNKAKAKIGSNVV